MAFLTDHIPPSASSCARLLDKSIDHVWDEQPANIRWYAT